MGGFGSGDDLSFVGKYLGDVDTIDVVKELILSGGNQYLARPVSSALLVITHVLFKLNTSLYIATGIILWLISIVCIYFMLKHYFDHDLLYIFFLHRHT